MLVEGIDAAGGDGNCEVDMRVDPLTVAVDIGSLVVMVVVIVGVPKVS